MPVSAKIPVASTIESSLRDCGRKTHFSRMQILFFPLPPPFYHILSMVSTLFFSFLFPAPLPLKPAGKPLRKAPETPEKSPRKTSLNILSASSPPRKEKKGLPENSLFLGFLKGSGEEESEKGKDAEEEKPRAIRWLEKF